MICFSNRFLPNSKSPVSIIFVFGCSLVLGVTYYYSHVSLTEKCEKSPSTRINTDEAQWDDNFISHATKKYNLMTETGLRDWRARLAANMAKCTIGKKKSKFFTLLNFLHFNTKYKRDNEIT